jgi:hypothetical protein
MGEEMILFLASVLGTTLAEDDGNATDNKTTDSARSAEVSDEELSAVLSESAPRATRSDVVGDYLSECRVWLKSNEEATETAHEIQAVYQTFANCDILHAEMEEWQAIYDAQSAQTEQACEMNLGAEFSDLGADGVGSGPSAGCARAIRSLEGIADILDEKIQDYIDSCVWWFYPSP